MTDIPQHAVDAALDAFSGPNWRNSAFVDAIRPSMSRAISAALSAMGRIPLADGAGIPVTPSVIGARKALDVTLGRVKSVDAEAVDAPHEHPETCCAHRYVDGVCIWCDAEAPDDLVSRVDALEQDGAHDHDEIMTQGARIAELEVRPVWTKEKEDLLHRLTTEMSQTLAWRGRNEQAHDIADLRDAAFPEQKS